MPQKPRRSWLARLGLQRQPMPDARPTSVWTFQTTTPDTNPITTRTEQLQNALGWVGAAVTLISEDVRTSEWDAWRKTGANREDWKVAQNTPAVAIIEKPNPRDTLADILELTDQHFSLTGMWFWHLIRAGERGRVTGFEVIYPNWVTEPVFTMGRHTGWRVTIPGQPPVTMPREDVIWGRRPHPIDAWGALSQLQAAANAHYTDLYTRAYAHTLLRNDGGVPAGLLSTDQEISNDQADAIRARWRENYSRSHDGIAVLGQATKYQSLGIPVQDLDFLKLGDFNREQVLAMFRVPPAVLGQTRDFNRANADAALIAYQRHALAPRLARYQDVINHQLLPALGGRGVFFEFRDPVDSDDIAEADQARSDLAAGAITVNEYRERIGLDPTSSGDVFLVPSTVTIKAALEETEPEPAPQLPAPTQGDDQGTEDEDETGRAIDRVELAALRRDNHELRRAAFEERWYRAWRGTVSGWMTAARKHGYANDWTPPRDDLTAARVDELPARLEDEDTLAYLERLKGPAGKQLAKEVTTCAFQSS